MKTYQLPEFAFLLKLGLWTGGHMGGFGYVSPAQKTFPSGNMYGISGISLNESVTLEKYEYSGSNILDLFFSVYEPYEGSYTCWKVSTAYLEDVETALFSVVTASGKVESYGGITWKEYAETSLQSKRRYVAAYSSMRSGAIIQPRHKIR